MSKFTLLAKEQIFGNEQLEIFKKYGPRCAATDFAVLLGVIPSLIFTASKDNGSCWWWTKTGGGDNEARIVTRPGDCLDHQVDMRNGGFRPALPYSLIFGGSSNEVLSINGLIEVEYGEYPQTIVDDELAKLLDKSCKTGAVQKTGKVYTTDSISLYDSDAPFVPRTFEEYSYEGRKFIRFVADYNSKIGTFSNGKSVEIGRVYWVEVEPIKWLIDKKEDIAVSKKVLFSGVQFNSVCNYKGNFSKTDAKKFLDEYFAKDIVAQERTKTDTIKTDLDICNMSIEELIKYKENIIKDIDSRIAYLKQQKKSKLENNKKVRVHK